MLENRKAMIAMKHAVVKALDEALKVSRSHLNFGEDHIFYLIVMELSGIDRKLRDLLRGNHEHPEKG